MSVATEVKRLSIPELLVELGEVEARQSRLDPDVASDRPQAQHLAELHRHLRRELAERRDPPPSTW